MQILDIQKAGLSAVMALGLIIATAGQAGATTTVVSADTMFTVNFLLEALATDDNGNTLPGTEDLTASMKFTITNYTDDGTNASADFSVKITNTSITDITNPTVCDDKDGNPVACGPDAILSIGFFTDPDVVLSNKADLEEEFSDILTNANLPGFMGIDICIVEDKCQSGKVADGLQGPNGMDTVTFTLSWDGGDLTIGPSALKFQGDRGSFEFDDNGNGGVPPPPQVPEPATLLLFGIGLLGLGVVARRRRFAA